MINDFVRDLMFKNEDLQRLGFYCLSGNNDDKVDVSDLHLCPPLPQYGFNMVMSHPHAVNEIALSLNNRNPRSVQNI